MYIYIYIHTHICVYIHRIFGLYDIPDHKTHLGFRGGKYEKNFEAENVVLLLPPVTLLHCLPPP